MREVFINDVLAVLPPGTGIPYEKLNPAFNDIGSHTLDFTFLLTDEIKQVLQFPNRLTGKTAVQAIITIKYDGRVFITGPLIVIGTSNDKTAHCFMASEEGDFYYNGAKLNLHDINYGTDVTLGTTSQEVADYATATVEEQYPDVDFNFPAIEHPELYGTDKQNNLDFIGWVNVYNPASGFDINIIYEDPTPDNLFALNPFLYLFFVIKKVLYQLNFKPLGNFWSNENLKKILLYNNFPLDWNEKKYYVRAAITSDQALSGGLIYNGDPALMDGTGFTIQHTIVFDDESNTPNEDADNVYDPDSGFYNIAKRGYHSFVIKGRIANISAAETILVEGRIKIGSTTYHSFNIVIAVSTEIDWEHKATVYFPEVTVGSDIKYTIGASTTTLANSCILKSGLDWEVNNDSYCALNQFSRTLHYSNHVPDITVSEFMKQVEGFFGHVSFIDNIKREHRMLSYNDIFNGSVVNEITVLEGITIEHERLKTLQAFTFDNDGYSENNFLDYSKYAYVGEYTHISSLPTPTIIGQVAKIKLINAIYITVFDETLHKIIWQFFSDIQTPIETGNVDDEQKDLTSSAAPILMGEHAVYGLMPKIKNVATSVTFNTGLNDMPTRFMFYHGLINCPLGFPIPLASSLKYDSVGTEQTDFSLTLEDLSEQFFSKYIDYLTTEHKAFIRNAILTPLQLQELKLWEKFRPAGIESFIKRISCELLEDHISECEIEFLPV